MTTTITKPDWRVPGAKLILRADADRTDWLNQRTLGLGGSDMAILMGVAHHEDATIYKLWETKTADEAPPQKTAHQLRHGSDVEPILADWFTQDTGIAVRQVGMYQSKANPVWFANPDRLTSDGGILEIKTTSRFTHNGKAWLDGYFPKDAYVQVQWYLHVTGRSHAWLAGEVDNSDFFIKGELPRDEELIERMIAKAEWFWPFVESKTPPPLDLATVTPNEVTHRFPEVIDPESTAEALIPDAALDDVQLLGDLKAEKKEIDDEIKSVETRLKAQIGDKEYLTIDGRPVARWQQVAGRKSFDKAAVLEKICAERGLEPTKQNLKAIEAEFTKTGAPTRRLSLIEREAA